MRHSLIFRAAALFAAAALSVSLSGKTSYVELFEKEDGRAGNVLILHKVGQKVYLEIPDAALGKPFLVGSVVERSSDPLESYAGYVPCQPEEIQFLVADSCVFVARPSHRGVSDDEFSQRALDIASIPAVVKSFKILCRGEGDDASVCDITTLFTTKSKFNDALSPVAFNASEGYVKRSSTFLGSNAIIKGVGSDSSEVFVVGSVTVRVKSAFLGVFSAGEEANLTSDIRYYLRSLPETPAVPEKADIRAGYDVFRRTRYSPDGKGTYQEYLTSRRDLSRPVVFSVDENFPAVWAEAIEEAVANWNSAFEKAGVAAPLSTRRSSEGPDVIRYVVSPVQKIFDQKVCDPRSGEIISSGIYVNHGVQEAVQKMLLLQTSAANPGARRVNIDDSLLKTGLCAMMMRHIGHVIGLRDNLIGSFAYSPRDIADPVFSNTRGISASVMDRLPFNYLAESEEALVAQTEAGPADIFSLKCLYVHDYETVREEIARHFDDAELAFRAMPSAKTFYDPRTEYGDLGNDVLYSVSAGLRHLKYAVENVNDWVREEDKDYCYRNYLYNYVLDQLHDYIRHGFEYIGGMYVNVPDNGLDTPAARAVPREFQKKCLANMLETIDSLEWLDNLEFTSSTDLEGPFHKFAEKYFTNFVFIQLAGLDKIRNLSGDVYTQTEAARDIMSYYWGKDPEDELTVYQKEIFIDNVSNMMKTSREPEAWYGLLKECGKLARKSGDAYHARLIDIRLKSI